VFAAGALPVVLAAHHHNRSLLLAGPGELGVHLTEDKLAEGPDVGPQGKHLAACRHDGIRGDVVSHPDGHAGRGERAAAGVGLDDQARVRQGRDQPEVRLTNRRPFGEA